MISSIFRAPRLLSNSTVKLQVNLFSTQKILALNELTAIEGSRKPKRRVGRGIGSGRGKNSGNGHQKSSATPFGFEGGQTPLYKRLPKIGFNNYAARDLQHLNVSKIQEYIDTGRLVPKENNLIHLRDLLECKLITSVKEGVKLLAKDKDLLTSKIHLEVSFASTEAIRAVERAGGTVTCVHFNRLAIRAITQPLKFDILPRRARPNPKIMDYYLDKDKSGYLSPEIQQRNLKLFGFVTSEEQCKEEHLKYMHMRRKYIQLEKSLRQEIESGKKQAGQAELSVSE